MRKSITIIGRDQDGQPVCETVVLSDDNTVYSGGRYIALGAEQQSLHFHGRLVLSFLKKRPVISGGIQ